MALSKVNFNSLNVTPSASKAIKFNSSNNGLETGDIGGNLVLISEQTASSSSAISFTSGIDSTYKEYIFKFTDVHAANDQVHFQFNMSVDGGSNYNVTKTTTAFRAGNYENDSSTAFSYLDSADLAQGTGFQNLEEGASMGNDNDQCCSGSLHLFDPSNTTFIKHFIARTNNAHWINVSTDGFFAGYGNTTSAVNAIQFKMSSGNIDAGTFKLYGVS
jgi:hypothetical protein